MNSTTLFGPNKFGHCIIYTQPMLRDNPSKNSVECARLEGDLMHRIFEFQTHFYGCNLKYRAKAFLMQ